MSGVHRHINQGQIDEKAGKDWQGASHRPCLEMSFLGVEN